MVRFCCQNSTFSLFFLSSQKHLTELGFTANSGLHLLGRFGMHWSFASLSFCSQVDTAPTLITKNLCFSRPLLSR